MGFIEWANDALPGRTTQGWARLVGAALFTFLSVVIVALLWRRAGAIGDPGLYLLFTVAAATYLAGGMAGMLSAAIVLFCSFLLFSHPLYPFRYSDLDWRQMMVVAIACPIIALMVGSLKEQVDRLTVVTEEARALRNEIERLEAVREAQLLCEQRFRLMAGCMTDYAVCVLDAGGLVQKWNSGAERLLGYLDQEIVGQSYSRFFAKDELLARHPDRLLEQARFSGQMAEEGWRLRKGGARFPSRTHVIQMRDSHGAGAGYLLVIRDLTQGGNGPPFTPPG